MKSTAEYDFPLEQHCASTFVEKRTNGDTATAAAAASEAIRKVVDREDSRAANDTTELSCSFSARSSITRQLTGSACVLSRLTRLRWCSGRNRNDPGETIAKSLNDNSPP